VNFDDKLKGLEDQPGYPKEKAFAKKKAIGGSLAPYNIVSNKNF